VIKRRKSRIEALCVLFAFILQIFCAFLPTPAFSYPAYVANSDLVIAAPYDTATAGVGPLGLLAMTWGYRVKTHPAVIASPQGEAIRSNRLLPAFAHSVFAKATTDKSELRTGRRRP
jgi:hypothetical protein